MITIIVIIILTLFAGTRTSDVAPDYYQYSFFFKQLASNSTKYFILKFPSLEYCMIIIPKIIEIFVSNVNDIVKGSFVLFAFIGVSLKMTGIRKFSPNYFISVILYFGYLFLMQEMITIRAGIASGLFFYSIVYLDKKKLKTSLIFLILTLLFHYSSVICFVIYLLLFFKIKYKSYFIMLGASIIIAVIKIDVISLLGIGGFFPKVEEYSQLQKSVTTELNLFNFRILFALGIMIIYFFYIKRLQNLPLFNYFYKVHIISIIFFFMFSSLNMTFSLRSFELLSVCQLITYCYIINIFPKKFISIPYVILIAYSVLQCYYLIEVSDNFKPYQSWLF